MNHLKSITRLAVSVSDGLQPQASISPRRHVTQKEAKLSEGRRWDPNHIHSLLRLSEASVHEHKRLTMTNTPSFALPPAKYWSSTFCCRGKLFKFAAIRWRGGFSGRLQVHVRRNWLVSAAALNVEQWRRSLFYLFRGNSVLSFLYFFGPKWSTVFEH